MPLSAVDVVSPAFQRTKELLFKPFRFAMWWRLAIISALAGEISGSSGGPTNFNIPANTHPQQGGDHLLGLSLPPAQLVLIVTVLVAAALLLFILLILLNSVFRFILFDVIVTGRYRIREGWRRWFADGARYFWWQAGVSLAMLLALSLLVGVPVLLAWRAGVFREPGQHVALLVLGGLVLFVLLVLLVIVGALVAVFSKDFLVPMMALEKVGPIDGWRRLWPMLRAEGSSYAAYVGMKIVLAMGAGIIFGIITLIVLLILAIPVGILAVAVVAIAAGMGLSWNPLTIALAVVLGGLALVALMFLIAIINVPAAVFFEAYPLIFLAARYPALDALLHPASPPAPPAPVPAPAPA